MRRMNRRVVGALLGVLIVMMGFGLAAVGWTPTCKCVGSDCYEDVLVSGAGFAAVNGTYEFNSVLASGRPMYTHEGSSAYLTWVDSWGGGWYLTSIDGSYLNRTDSATPPTSGDWLVVGLGTTEPGITLVGGEACTPPASITVSEISGDTGEDGTTATFTVSFSPTPTHTVYVPLTISDASEGSFNEFSSVASFDLHSLINGDSNTVTVYGWDDDMDDGDIDYTVVTGDPYSDDPEFDALGADDVDDVRVTNVDDDTRGVTVTPTSGLTTTEDGGTATFTVVLDSKPVLSCGYASPGESKAWAGVMIELSSSNPAEGTIEPTALVFTEADWDQPQTVTITGVDDAVLDGDIGFTIVTEPAIGGDYSGLNAADVSVTNLDNEVAIVIVPTGAGGPEAFLDVLLPLGEGETAPLAGDEPLVASYVIGDLITGSCQFLGPSGNPTADGYVHLYLYSVDITATPEALELIAHWTADFNWTTFEFEFAYDTSGLTPGYYDLRLSFPDGTSQTFRIEVTPAV